MAQAEAPYPVQFSVDYPDRPLGRLSTFFRLILIIPIAVVLATLGGIVWGEDGAIWVGGTLFLPPLLLILFRQRYPRWWFDWNVALLKFGSRVSAYFLLLRDEYPSTEDEQAVRLEVAYPDAARDLNRWLPLIKWFLAIPHYVALVFLGVLALVLALVAWLAILFTGRYPAALFSIVVGVMRWSVRVEAYAFLLTTDRYPPFRLS